MHWRYIFAGLEISSELEIPEWEIFAVSGDRRDADVVIAADCPENPAPAAMSRHASRRDRDVYEFDVPDVGRFTISDGREIRVRATGGAPPRKVRAFLLGSAWGALWYQRGELVLHASAIRAGDRAVLFCARAGNGKSTLVAALAQRGWVPISDDLCFVQLPGDGYPSVCPSTPRFKLWSDSVGQLGWAGRNMEPDPFREGKFHVPCASIETMERVDVREICMLSWGELAIRRLTGLAAYRRFLDAATYRRDMLEPMDRLGAHSGRCLDLLRRVPVWELSRPRDFAAMGRTLQLLEAHLSEPADAIV